MTLTQHAHSQHKGVHGVGQTSSSPPRPWRKHHFLRLGLLTFYLWMEHKRCCLSGLATNKTIYCIKEGSNSYKCSTHRTSQQYSPYLVCVTLQTNYESSHKVNTSLVRKMNGNKTNTLWNQCLCVSVGNVQA